MATKRDDFTEGTKRIAAGRVGYRCSFPGCQNATIGASMVGDDKTSITGVAAHICAAAEGGPRYDETMSPEQRKGVGNCIWMCQTHARLIDTDPITYTTEKLRQWKKEAEENASRALADTNYYTNYFKSNGENLAVMEQTFDGMVIDGSFELLHKILLQYDETLSEKYAEFVLRYTVIYDTYCCRADLNRDLNKYISLADKTGVDSLIELFLSFLMVDKLKSLVEFCHDSELKELTCLAINGELEKRLFREKNGDAKLNVSIKHQDLVFKVISNIVVEKKLIGVEIQGRRDDLPYKDEFYYQIIAACYRLICSAYYNSEWVTHPLDNNLTAAKTGIEKVKCLDIELQIFIWNSILRYLLPSKGEFDSLYNICPEAVKNDASMRQISYLYSSYYDKDSFDINEVLLFSEEQKQYNTLLHCLLGLPPEKEVEFLDNHQFLYYKDSRFLYRRVIVLSHRPLRDVDSFLEQFKETYQDNFMFHCLLERVSAEQAIKKTEVAWLKGHAQPLDTQTMLLYLKILFDNAEWDELKSISYTKLPNEYLFVVANYLAESEEDFIRSRSEEIYQDLIQKDWQRQWLHYNCATAQMKLGRVEEAKRNYQAEYDQFKNKNALRNLLVLRIDTNEIINDQYLHDLEHCIDAGSQNLVAVIYLRLGNNRESRKYFLRSLLLDDQDNPSINGYWSASEKIEHSTPNQIMTNTVCTLQNQSREIKIALHSPDIIEGIRPNEFAGCLHFSAEDILIASLIFHKLEDTVYYQGEEYRIASLSTTEEVFIKYAFSRIVQHPETIRFETNRPEEFIEKLTAFMKDSSEDISKRIQVYNDLELRYPLTIFAKIMGRPMLASCEFLAFGNSEHIRNNPSSFDLDTRECRFVLAYDSIVFLVHLSLEVVAQSNLSLCCAMQVKNQLISDIDAEINHLSDASNGGSLIYAEGKLTLIENTADSRRERYSFLTRLKNFVNSLNIADSHDFSGGTPEIQNIFRNQHLYCESGTLAAAQSHVNSIVVTDDQFLFAVGKVANINSIGIISLLSQSNASWEQLLSASKQLAKMNFINYFPINLYKKIVDLLIEEESQIERGTEEIVQWITSDTVDEPTPHHCGIIIDLYREVYFAGLEYLNPGNYLADIALNFFVKLNPEFVKKCIADVLEKMQFRLEAPDNSD